MFSNDELSNFIEENKDQLKIEYIDFNYVVINPKSLLGTDEFNQSFFDKIDEIEIDISNDVSFEAIVSKYNFNPISINDFKFSKDKNIIEKKIFELRNNDFDIFENGDDYILFKLNNTEQKVPDLNDNQTKNEIAELLAQKNKFEYNKKLLEKINNKKFDERDFKDLGKNKIETIKLNSMRDNTKFEINAVEILYSLPVNSYTLINDEENNIYLAKIKNFEDQDLNDDNQLKEYTNKQNSKMKNYMLESYDFYINKKYEVNINQKTIERVKNFFQ